MVRTKIINVTDYEIHFKQGTGGIFLNLATVRPGQSYRIGVDPSATYREDFRIEVDGRLVLPISTDDLVEAEEITVYETSEKTIEWRISKLRSANRPPFFTEDIHNLLTASTTTEKTVAFDDLRKDVSSRVTAMEESLARLEELLLQVQICCAQCGNLVKVSSDGIASVQDIYSQRSTNDMWELYGYQKLKLLKSSLEGLLITLGSAQDLLLACGSKWGWMGLVMTIPLPATGKQALSNFDLLIKEMNWKLDMIRFALDLRKDTRFIWDENKCRSVLALKDGAPVAAADEANLGESDPLASEDCDGFISQLKNGSILTDNQVFARVLKQRTETVIPSPYSASDSRTSPVLESALEKFRITDLDPDTLPKIMKSAKPLASGALKATYRGEWCGIVVAIDVTKCEVEALVKKEARLMLSLQHPNVVGFLGWGFLETRLLGIPHTLADDKSKKGFFVMELMERDLRNEIELLVQSKSSENGGPFPWPVAVDILQQLVEAMVHMHNLNHTHRDLKAGNILVNWRPLLESISEARMRKLTPTSLMKWLLGGSISDMILTSACQKPRTAAKKCSPPPALISSLGLDSEYTVKLIDFGTSKMIDPEIKLNTLNTGSRPWMAPECRTTKEQKSTDAGGVAEYDPKAADIYSFGMVCYEVLTGRQPFDGLGSSGIYMKLHNNEAYSVRGEPLLKVPPTSSCPENLKELMSKCLAFQPSNRPTFKKIQEDLWTIRTDLATKDVK